MEEKKKRYEKPLEIKKKYEKPLRDNFENKNAEMNKTNSSLKEKKEQTEGDSLYSLKYKDGCINEALLESRMGNIFNAEEIVIAATNSVQMGDGSTISLEDKDEDTCSLTNEKSPYLGQVNQHGKKEKQFTVITSDICVINYNEIFFTDLYNKLTF